MEQYALQQQIELLQAQQAMLQNQQSGLSMGPPAFLPNQLAPQPYAAPTGHRRGQSMSQPNAGPPPAPSSGTSGFTEVTHQRRGSQSGHNRRHSLALPEARRAAEKAQAMKQSAAFAFPNSSSSTNTGGATNSDRSIASGDPVSPQRRNASPQRRSNAHARSQSNMSNRNATSPVRTTFQFPPGQGLSSQTMDSNIARSSSGHGRQGSRTFEANWRSGPPVTQEAPYFTPGHRARSSVSSSISSLQNFGQGYPYAQSLPVLGMMTPMGPIMQQTMQQPQPNSNAQQRKSLFSPYLPQATLPALLSDGRLVAGTLRVNKKNRSDAYVSTDLLDDDIFICGSKDRNRALEGDYVAVELLDVDEVWFAKRDKEDKKKRKDHTGMNAPGLKRQGSIRDRPEAKKKDDIEVEGQGLLLVDEEEVNDDQKPMYAGHIVAVIERTAGQMFSGTLGLLRPSSAATKEKQDAERRERDGPVSTSSNKQSERPKIVWFKPTDKRVPLIAIPTEQAPKDFVENHEAYKNRLFVACIKRWPITSLHPFGTLVEELGHMGDVATETEALLRDNGFLAENFSTAVLDAVNQIESSIDIDAESRKDFRGEKVFSISKDDSSDYSDAFHIRKTDEGYEVGVHIADIDHFVRPGFVLDREARKRGSKVMLVDREIPLLPSSLTGGVASFLPDIDRRAISIVFKISPKFALEDSWIGRSVIRNTKILSPSDLHNALNGGEFKLDDEELQSDLQSLGQVARSLRELRCPSLKSDAANLKWFQALDQEVEIRAPFVDASPQLSSNEFIRDELLLRADMTVAEHLLEHLAGSAILRRQAPPTSKKLDQMILRASRLGVSLDVSSTAGLLNSIAAVENHDVRKALEIFLVKACSRPKYVLAGTSISQVAHFATNLPLYTHFSKPFDRYADLLAHRQLASVLENKVWQEDPEALAKVIDLCNNRKDSAKVAQEQSIHLMLCAKVHETQSKDNPIVRHGLVINVMESSFDVFLPDFGVEKRVHLDQLPLHKAEFDATSRKLELYWLKRDQAESWRPAESDTQVDKKRPDDAVRSATTVLENMNLQSEPGSDNSRIVSQSAPSSPPKRHPLPTERPASSTAIDGRVDSTSTAVHQSSPVTKLVDGIVVQELSELSIVEVVLHADCVHKSPPLLLLKPVQPAHPL